MQSSSSESVELFLDTFLFAVALLEFRIHYERQKMSTDSNTWGLAVKLYLTRCDRAVILEISDEMMRDMDTGEF